MSDVLYPMSIKSSDRGTAIESVKAYHSHGKLHSLQSDASKCTTKLPVPRFGGTVGKAAGTYRAKTAQWLGIAAGIIQSG
ncbi:hypothetical protein PspLS_02112 [Pyricularia sp. CBS 133598]|nr:hypothetical protein PspLS_02112 [Pyricularia sp. CBS 133598]